jgi:hypothetical protein
VSSTTEGSCCTPRAMLRGRASLLMSRTDVSRNCLCGAASGSLARWDFTSAFTSHRRWSDDVRPRSSDTVFPTERKPNGTHTAACRHRQLRVLSPSREGAYSNPNAVKLTSRAPTDTTSVGQVGNAKMRGYLASLLPSRLGSWIFRQTASFMCYLPFLYSRNMPFTTAQFTTFHQAFIYSGLRFWYLR